MENKMNEEMFDLANRITRSTVAVLDTMAGRGAFRGEDKLLIINDKAESKTVTPQMELHFDQVPMILERWVKTKPITAVYFDQEKERYFIKRFLIENENIMTSDADCQIISLGSFFNSLFG